jgi:hypothetical protein
MSVSRTRLLSALTLLALAGVSRAADPSSAPRDGKVYIISNVHSGKRLAIEGGSREPHAGVVQDDSTKTHVTWRLEKLGDGVRRAGPLGRLPERQEGREGRGKTPTERGRGAAAHPCRKGTK